MNLIGYRDLNLREITDFMNEELNLVIEKKIEGDFRKIDQNDPKITTKNLEIFNIPETTFFPPLIHKKFERAFELSILISILKRKDLFTFETFTKLVHSLNQNKSLNTILNLTSILTTEEELKNLQSIFPQTITQAFLILSTYLARLYQDLTKIETCVHFEKHKIGLNFLNEIEKGYLDDRRLIKQLDVYKNYFKNFATEKNDPPANIYNEIHVTSQIEFGLNCLEKIFLGNLSFEKKASLQNKSIHENTHLNSFVESYSEILDSISGNVTRLQKIKTTRGTFNLSVFFSGLEEMEKKSDCVQLKAIAVLSKAIIADIERIYSNLRAKEVEDLKALDANKKYKRKISESWLILEDLISEKSLSESKTSKKFLELNAFLLNFDFKELTLANFKILAAPVEIGKKPKIPKGTRDTTPLQMIIKFKAIEKIRSVYYRHGAVEIDTPIFELKETLLGKYGEEGGKLIYDLEDQGGELLSLRYDLTVPFARYMGLNNYSKMKRFHIGKVYRRDQPNINRGRFREFYQCDFDIAGKTESMLAEAEILKIAVEILSGFDLKFKIKISHRLLLEAIIECANCEPKKFKTICSSIDKLDKEPWENVEKELIVEKGLVQSQTNVLKRIVLNKGSIAEVLNLAQSLKLFGENAKAKQSLEEIKALEKFVNIFGISDYVELDLSLARGLDYYTGIIYEGVLTEGEYGLGSIAGGGRYDELIGMFSKDKIPAIGISIGIERLFMILEEKYKNECRASETEFLIATIGKTGVLEKKLELANLFWNGKVKTEILYDLYPKPDKQLKYALEKKIPFILWIGEDEIAKKQYKIKIMYKKEEIVVMEEDLIEQSKKLSAIYKEDLEKGLVVYAE